MQKKDISDFKLTYEQLKSIKQLRLIMMPARVLFALAFFALICGGPRRFFSELPGPLFVLLFGVYLKLCRIRSILVYHFLLVVTPLSMDLFLLLTRKI